MASSRRRIVLVGIAAFVITFYIITQSRSRSWTYVSEWRESSVHWLANHQNQDSHAEPPSQTLDHDHAPPFASPANSRPNDNINADVPVPVPAPAPAPAPAITNTTANEPTVEPINSLTSEQLKIKIDALRALWTPPNNEEHFPPYNGYHDRDFDPNRWEGFPWNNNYYISTGVKDVDSQAESFAPYPDYNSPQWQQTWRGTYAACKGARGKLLNASEEDTLKAYNQLPSRFPDASYGVANLTGQPVRGRCFDRYHRLGPYGFGQEDRDAPSDWHRPDDRPDWSSVHWKQLQDQCLLANRDRYTPEARQPSEIDHNKDVPKIQPYPPHSQQVRIPSYQHRTAVLLRITEEYKFSIDERHNLRAMITELSLLSGGEYEIFLMVQVEDVNMDIWRNEQMYQEVLRQVPREFRNISMLWNEKMLEEWYPKVGNWATYWHPYMATQWFSIKHPEFDFVWNLDADMRYVGNWYDLLNGISRFAKNLPRKYLWELNQRFYVPSAHGSYSDFVADTYASVKRAADRHEYQPIWGEQSWDKEKQSPIGPDPPSSMENDTYTWGVGEEADLITLQPIWNPIEVDWAFKDIIWNFLYDYAPQFTEEDPQAKQFRHREFANITRRTSIGSSMRFSKTLLYAMHVENLAGRTMAAEMWPTTAALHHGLKAVYAPHPVWTDREWPGWYLDAVLNANGGKEAQWGSRGDSIWIFDRSHNLAGTTWFEAAGFAKTLYRRWLGLRRIDPSPVAFIGGREWEDLGYLIDLPIGEHGKDVEFVIGGRGRMCLPPMLLQPVKDVDDEEVNNQPVPVQQQTVEV